MTAKLSAKELEKLEALAKAAISTSEMRESIRMLANIDPATILRLTAQVREAEAQIKEAESILTDGQRQRLSWRRDAEGR